MSGPEVLAKGMQDCPPLPEYKPDRPAGEGASNLPLVEGCYFISYGRDVDLWYQGTLRVEQRDGQLLASGDLYAPDNTIEHAPVGEMPPPVAGIPIFPIAAYTFYLRVTKIEAAGAGFALTFEAHRYFPNDVKRLDGFPYERWTLERSYTAQMALAAAPQGYPEPQRFFVGTVALSEEEPSFTAQLQIGWVSPLLRKAVIEIDCVPDAHAPLDNGAGVSWQSVFQAFGWEVKAIDSDHNITKTSTDPLWRPPDAEIAMQAHRDNSNLDAEWRFYILIASLIFAPQEADGWMYHAKREALYVASQFTLPDQAAYGALRGKRLDTTVAFFRAVMHELGHAMGLGHNQTGFHFMRPTPSIATEALADKPFPANIDWTFAPEDENRLRHWPDIAVRPGGAIVGIGADLLPQPNGRVRAAA